MAWRRGIPFLIEMGRSRNENPENNLEIPESNLEIPENNPFECTYTEKHLVHRHRVNVAHRSLFPE
jgi:hypothetical protein